MENLQIKLVARDDRLFLFDDTIIGKYELDVGYIYKGCY